MTNKNFHIIALITANIGLIDQVNKHFAETRVFLHGNLIPMKHLKKLYKLIIHHHEQTEKPSLLLLKILGDEISHVKSP